MDINHVEQLLEKYSSSYDKIKNVVENLKEAELNFKPGPDNWSIKEILNHLCDSELMAVTRMQKIIAEENPLLFAYDQNVWANKLMYQNLNPMLSLTTFGFIRQRTYQLLKLLPESVWDRTGIHTEKGKITLYDLLETYAIHSEKHLEQINNNLSKISSK